MHDSGKGNGSLGDVRGNDHFSVPDRGVFEHFQLLVVRQRTVYGQHVDVAFGLVGLEEHGVLVQ